MCQCPDCTPSSEGCKHSKTVDEVRELRHKLESDIVKLIADFEKESGVKVETFDSIHTDCPIGSDALRFVSVKVKIAH